MDDVFSDLQEGGDIQLMIVPVLAVSSMGTKGDEYSIHVESKSLIS
jgi:hypothetical protein